MKPTRHPGYDRLRRVPYRIVKQHGAVGTTARIAARHDHALGQDVAGDGDVERLGEVVGAELGK